MYHQIITFTLQTSHKHGDILKKLFKFRHKGFIEEQGWNVQSYDGLEFDKYDNPFAHYIVILDKNDIVACSRINRTDISYMAKDCWSEHIPPEELPCSKEIYEWTRVYISPYQSKIQQMQFMYLILTSTYAYSAKIGVTELCYVTYQTLVNSTKKLEMQVTDVTNFEIPNDRNPNIKETLHFAKCKVSVDQARIVIKNCIKSMPQVNATLLEDIFRIHS